MDINIELRSEVLKYSLIIESIINDLILVNLGIYDEKEKTKLFSNKGKISFQNKIDLLYDIEVLSKEDNSDFELLMNIRNKFLHDINCNSFQDVLNQLDKGIVKRFKKYLDDEKLIYDEDACKKGCHKLFQKNIETVKKKLISHKISSEKKYRLYELQNKQIVDYINLLQDLLEKVLTVTENSESENPKGAILRNEILHILEEAINKLNIESKTSEFEEFLNSDETMKSVFGIKRGLKDLPKWSDFKMGNSNKSNN